MRATVCFDWVALLGEVCFCFCLRHTIAVAKRLGKLENVEQVWNKCQPTATHRYQKRSQKDRRCGTNVSLPPPTVTERDRKNIGFAEQMSAYRHTPLPKEIAKISEFQCNKNASKRANCIAKKAWRFEASGITSQHLNSARQQDMYKPNRCQLK